MSTPRSFEEVINHVFEQYGISTLPGNRYFCNPYSIDFPKPFGTNLPVTHSYSNRIDTCGCSRFAAIKLEALSSNVDTASFGAMNSYLKEKY
ncbi:MAG: hypothetical protein EOO77_24095, partial [Oxalobacteraceae bacterium]